MRSVRSTGSEEGFGNGVVPVVLRDIGDQLANHPQAFGVILRQEMRHAADDVMRFGSAQLFLGDVFVRDGLDHVRAGDEHVAGVVHHEDEIGQRGRVDRAAGARAHDGGDLRDHAACERVAQKDIGVAGQRQHAFLDARAAGIVQADDGSAGFERQIHDLADFERVGFRQRAAEHGEILSENVNRAAVNAAEAGDETVAIDDLLVHAEIGAAMPDQLVHLLECVFVQQQIDALARREFAFFVLPRIPFFAAACFGNGMAAPHFRKTVHGHRNLTVAGRLARGNGWNLLGVVSAAALQLGGWILLLRFGRQLHSDMAERAGLRVGRVIGQHIARADA